MSWAPTDLLSDADLLAYDERILTQFGRVEWRVRRAKALEDWLWPSLRAAGFAPERFRTRYAATAVYGYTSSAYTDYTGAAADETTADVPLATILATTNDALYVGSSQPFRGLSCRLTDAVNAVARTLTVSLWLDTWHAVVVADSTQATAGTTFSQGGTLGWVVPEGWVARTVNGTSAYWAKVVASGALTAATSANQISVIRRSLLCGPVTHRTLALIYRAAPLGQDGPWESLAAWHEEEATKAMERALPSIGGEFDTGTEDDVIDADEAQQSADVARGAAAFTLDRL